MDLTLKPRAELSRSAPRVAPLPARAGWEGMGGEFEGEQSRIGGVEVGCCEGASSLGAGQQLCTLHSCAWMI